VILDSLFIVFLLAHVAFSLVTNPMQQDGQPRGRTRMTHVLMQGPLFWLATFIGWEQGVFSRQLVSPVYIATGLLAGHLIFGLSLLATHLSWRDAWSHFFDFGPIWNFTMDSPVVLTRFLGVAVAEELIWRVAAQTILIDLLSSWMPESVAVVAGILAVAAAFVVVHKHFFENTWHISLEFVIFALLLGGLYFWTGSFILVMVIHALRDIEIAYLEYLIKVEELGDAEQAAKAIEQAYMPGRPENV
jgi:membrane protease YdiL (CAAX protease family)